MRIGFWNVKKKSLARPITDLILAKDLDVLILAETTITTKALIADIRKVRPTPLYYPVINGNQRIKIVTRLDPKYISNFDKSYRGTYWSIFQIKLPRYPKFNLVGIHFPSKLFWDDLSQSFEAVKMMEQLRAYEAINGTSTVIIGDFNMNPYEAGMTSALGFHAINDKTLIRHRRERKINEDYFKFFYNPMWSHLGDKVVPGTYYYSKSVPNNNFWNTYDQALLSPEILQHFSSHDVEIVTSIGSSRLYPSKKGMINKNYSDHLPIVLTLNK